MTQHVQRSWSCGQDGNWGGGVGPFFVFWKKQTRKRFWCGEKEGGGGGGGD